MVRVPQLLEFVPQAPVKNNHHCRFNQVRMKKKLIFRLLKPSHNLWQLRIIAYENSLDQREHLALLGRSFQLNRCWCASIQNVTGDVFGSKR